MACFRGDLPMRVALCALLLALNVFGTGMAHAAEPAAATAPAPAPAAATAVTPVQTVDLAATSTTYTKAEIARAGEVAFGRASPEMNKLLAKVFDEMGEPSAYIDGRQAGGAFIFGASYGHGNLFHKVEGEQPIHWTGPSFGLDVGADGAQVFMLIYHLHDTNDMFRRFGAASGRAFAVGGLSAQYLAHDDVVVVPISLGVGLRLGVNAGWLNFTREKRLIPF
jgi:hypothetical protein